MQKGKKKPGAQPAQEIKRLRSLLREERDRVAYLEEDRAEGESERAELQKKADKQHDLIRKLWSHRCFLAMELFSTGKCGDADRIQRLSATVLEDRPDMEGW